MNSTTAHGLIDPAIKAVLDAHPDLSYEGWCNKGLYPPTAYAQSVSFPEDRTELYSLEAQKQIRTAIAFCQCVTLHPKVNSYAIKHLMERWGGEEGMSSYISNGCAIVGAMVHGYKAVRIRNSLNCYLQDFR